jgi:uncharacterized protein
VGIELLAVSKPSPYSIQVLDLIRRPGDHREVTLEIPAPERLGTVVIGVEAGEPVHIEARLESLHDGILVSAEVDTVASGECVRCLIDVREPIEVEFQELFAYDSDEAFDHQVIDDRVDLEPAVRDAVVLALPFQPVCQPDCLGLCPTCGVRLLDEPGHEHEAPIDPRWAALGEISESLQERDGAGTGVTEEKR